MDNKEALAWLKRELNHQKYCQDFADRRIKDKYQVVIDALTIAVDAVSERNDIDLRSKLAAAEKALSKINDIRNSIVGFQTVNWSEHIYPLVAALNEAGIKGLPYPEAMKYYGTMLERTKNAEQERDAAYQQVNKLLRLTKLG